MILKTLMYWSYYGKGVIDAVGGFVAVGVLLAVDGTVGVDEGVKVLEGVRLGVIEGV